MVTDKDLSWMAGMFEGEDSLYLSKNLYLGLTVVNNDPDLLKPFLTFGGRIIPRTTSNGYDWRLQRRNQIVTFIKPIEPFLKSAHQKERFNLARKVLELTVSQSLKDLTTESKALTEAFHKINARNYPYKPPRPI